MWITLLLQVALAVPPARAVSPAVVRAAIAEAGRVWAPYGVAVDAAPDDDAECGSDPDAGGIILRVVLIETRHAAITPGWQGALGAITFSPGGAPVPSITVFLTGIERIVQGARIFGRPSAQWPLAFRDQLFGRVLGRVLAHEIGHYLLRSPRHAADGLMRSLQLADDLVEPSRYRYTLAAPERARLGEGR